MSKSLQWDGYQTALAKLGNLASVFSTHPPTTDNLPIIEEVVQALYPFCEVALIQRWQETLPAPIQALRVADLDGDGDLEIVAVTTRHQAVCFKRADEDSWTSVSSYDLPPLQGQVIGIAVEERRISSGQIVSIMANDGEHDRVFEAVFPASNGGCTLREIPTRQQTLHPALALCYGDPRTLPHVQTILEMGPQHQQYQIRMQRFRAAGGHQAAIYSSQQRIFALAYDQNGIFFGSGEDRLRRLAYEVQDGQLVEDIAWGESARVEGRVQAVCVCHLPEMPALVLAATDERQVAAFEAKTGKPAWSFTAPGDVLALDIVPDAPQVVTGGWDSTLRLYEMVGHQCPHPSAQGLEQCYWWAATAEGDEMALLARWLQQPAPDLAGFAAERLLDLLPRRPEAATLLENSLAEIAVCHTRQPTVLHLVALLEARLLAGAIEKDWAFTFLRRLHERCLRPVRRRIALAIARCAAQLPSGIYDDNYRFLREQRRAGDWAEAQALQRDGHRSDDREKLLSALALHSELLTTRRQVTWRFAAEGPISAVQLLPPEVGGAANAVVATRDGHLAWLNLVEKRVVQRHQLIEGGAVRALAVGDIWGGEQAELVVGTAEGWLHTYDLESGLDLKLPRNSYSIRHEIWSLALASRTELSDGQGRTLIGDGCVAYCRYDEASDRWEPVGDNLSTIGAWVRAMAVEDLEHAGCEEILIGDASDASLHIWEVVEGGRHLQLRFPTPVVAARPVRFSTPSGRPAHIAVACADGYVYLMDHQGQREWCYSLGHRARAMDLLDIDSNGNPEILIGMEDGYVHILDRYGRRRWAIPVGAPVMHVVGLILSRDRPHLLIADAEHILHLMEIIHPGGAPEQEVREAAVDCLTALAGGAKPLKPLSGWVTEPPAPYLPGYAFQALAELVQSGEQASVEDAFSLLVDFRPTADTPVPVQEAYLHALVEAVGVRTMGAAQTLLWQRLQMLVTSEEVALQAKLTVLCRLPWSEVLDEMNLPARALLLQTMAEHPSAAIRREAIRAMRLFLNGHQFPEDESPIWPILRHAAQPGSTDDEWVLEEVACIVRDLFRRDPAHALLLSHLLIRHGTNPQAFSALGDPQRNLLLDEDEIARHFFRCLGRFASAPAGKICPALTELTTALDVMVNAGLAGGNTPLVQVYRGLAALAGLSNYGALQTCVLEGGPLMEMAVTLEAGPQPVELFAGLHQALRALQGVLARGTRAYEEALHPRRLEVLRQFASELEALRSQLEPDHDAQPKRNDQFDCWRSALAAIIAHWLDEQDGALGKYIERLSRTFICEAQFLTGRVRGDEGRVEFRLLNIGYVTGHALQLGPPRAFCQGEELTCLAASKDFHRDRGRLDPDQAITDRVHIKLPSRHLAEWAQHEQGIGIEVRLPTEYLAPHPGRQELVFSSRLTPSLFDITDYLQAFPTSWAHYESQLKKALASHQRLLLVECEGSARRSVLDACLGLAPSDRHARLLDLKDIYRRALAGRPAAEGISLAVRPQDLHIEMARDLWPGNQALLNELRHAGGDFGGVFRRALRSSPAAPTTLILDHFDWLLIRLLQDDEERQTLAQTLDFWLHLTTDLDIQLVLGGHYLAQRILLGHFPRFHAGLHTLRPDYLIFDGAGRAEIEDFLEKGLAAYGLEGALALFSEPLSVPQLVDLCGGNLHFLHFFALDGLRRAHQKAQAPAGAARLAGMEPVTYLLEHAQRTNFFAQAWVWMSLYEKLALTLVAHAEFALEEKSWLVPGLILSRDYHPSLRPDQRTGQRRLSRKIEGRRGEALTRKLINKVRADKYFSSDSVWVQGLSSQRPPLLEREPPARMLIHLLNVPGRRHLLQELVREEVLVCPRTPAPVGEVYDFRIPLFRAFFARSGVFERMLGATQGDGGPWYPPKLHLDQRHPEDGRPLFAMRPRLQPVYQELPLNDLPRVHDALRKEDYPYFYNFYGIGRRELEPRRRWRALVALTRGLLAFHSKAPPPTQALTTDIFAPLARLLHIKPAPLPPQLGESGPAFQVFGDNGLMWQYSHFEGVFRGFRKNILLGIVHDGHRLASHVPALMDWADNLLQTAARQERWEKKEEERQPRPFRLVAVLLAQRGYARFQERLQAEMGYSLVKYAVLDGRDWADVCADSHPAKMLLRVCQGKVGRHTFSPYQTHGSVPPGSELFVGRDREIRAILDRVTTTDFVIVGSRRVGKTSLLRQVQYYLEKIGQYNVIPINFVPTVPDFFVRLGDWLERQYPGYQDSLGDGSGSYEGLRLVLERLYQDTGKQAVFLLDEIDRLYRHDLDTNEERFFVFIRDLSQSSPRLCSFVMTGYREIYLRKLDHRSVFFNFGRFVNIAQVEPESAAKLVHILEDYGVELYSREGATARLLEGTYCIPYLVQTACDRVLERLDRVSPKRLPEQRYRAEQEDIEAVLSRDVDRELKEELLDNIRVEYAVEGLSPQLIRLRMQIMLLSIVLGKYSYKQERSETYRVLKREDRSFTIEEVMGHMDDWADQIKPYWEWTRTEIDSLLRALTMTLAISVEDDGVSCHFPQEILPTVLFKRSSPIDELDGYIKQYIRVCEGK